ncbi:MAG: DNA repair protein RecO [Verrucomicrobiales bacterium]
MEKTQGILIRRYRLTESSLIVHWCSPDLGLIKTVAKGALRPKSAFAGRLDLFFGAEIEFVRSRSSDLHILRELAVTSPRLGLRASYLQTLAASYFVQLLELVAEKDTPIPEIHDLLERALNHLADMEPRLRSVTYFEEELADHLGIAQAPLPAHAAILQLYHHLPPGREELIERLGEE